MTVYKAIRAEAEAAVVLANDLARGKHPSVAATVDDQAGRVPSILLGPVAVTEDIIARTVIKDGFVTPSTLCGGVYADVLRGRRYRLTPPPSRLS